MGKGFFFPTEKDLRETEITGEDGQKVKIIFVQCPCGYKISLNDLFKTVIEAAEEAVGKAMVGEEDCNAWEKKEGENKEGSTIGIIFKHQGKWKKQFHDRELLE